MLDISQLADFLSSLPVRQLCGLILLLFKSFHFFNWDDFQKGADILSVLVSRIVCGFTSQFFPLPGTPVPSKKFAA